MTSISDPIHPQRRRLLAGAAALAAMTAGAFPPIPARATQPAITSQPFGENTWAGLLKGGPRPAAYLFTNTWCATCPAAFAKIKAHVDRHTDQPVELALVIMDADDEQARHHMRHYAGATRLYIFDGFAPAIRETIDPDWPDVTPYIVLLDKTGAAQTCIGPPSAAMLAKWLP